jgi:hypothetical protein
MENFVYMNLSLFDGVYIARPPGRGCERKATSHP